MLLPVVVVGLPLTLTLRSVGGMLLDGAIERRTPIRPKPGPHASPPLQYSASGARPPPNFAGGRRKFERVLSDDDLRDRLVTEGSEHVLSCDRSDVARRTGELYGELLQARA